MKRAGVIAVTTLGLVALLTGCGDTLEERIEKREKCIEAGGEWAVPQRIWRDEQQLRPEHGGV